MYTFRNMYDEVQVMTLMEASQLVSGDPAIKKRFEEILLNNKNKRRVKDGFEPGWQPNINRYAGGPGEYQKILKEEGLVEVGRDYVPQEAVTNTNWCHTEEFAMALKEQGESLTDNEVEAIKTGDFFKDIKIEE